METDVCPLCRAAADFRHLWNLPDRHMPGSAHFALVLCPQCQLAFLHPCPTSEQLEKHYPPAYYGAPPDDSPCYRWRQRVIEDHVPKGRILDYGCGNGGFLSFLQKRGWEVNGMDISPWAVQTAKKSLGDRVKQIFETSTGFDADSFDVVALFEVLEHIPDPAAVFKELHRILKPSGYLFFSVPNFASWERLLFGPWFNGLDAPRHLYQYTADTARRLLGQTGFTARSARSISAHHIQAHKSRIDYCQESIRFFLRDHGLYPQRPLHLQGFKTEITPSSSSSLSAALLKKIIFLAECTLFYPFWAINKIADRDNTLWVCAQKS